jgi:hypothetical protein
MIQSIQDSAKNALKILLDEFERMGNTVESEVVAELEYIIFTCDNLMNNPSKEPNGP